MSRRAFFVVPGRPRGKGRARWSRKSGRMYTPNQTRAYEQLVGLSARRALAVDWPKGERYRLEVSAYFRDRRSWPDADNILKAIADGLNRVGYDDDRQVDEKSVRRVLDPEAERVEVFIEVLDGGEG